jgi:hypothetical protein
MTIDTFEEYESLLQKYLDNVILTEKHDFDLGSYDDDYFSDEQVEIGVALTDFREENPGYFGSSDILF